MKPEIGYVHDNHLFLVKDDNENYHILDFNSQKKYSIGNKEILNATIGKNKVFLFLELKGNQYFIINLLEETIKKLEYDYVQFYCKNKLNLLFCETAKNELSYNITESIELILLEKPIEKEVFKKDLKGCGLRFARPVLITDKLLFLKCEKKMPLTSFLYASDWQTFFILIRLDNKREMQLDIDGINKIEIVDDNHTIIKTAEKTHWLITVENSDLKIKKMIGCATITKNGSYIIFLGEPKNPKAEIKIINPKCKKIIHYKDVYNYDLNKKQDKILIVIERSLIIFDLINHKEIITTAAGSKFGFANNITDEYFYMLFEHQERDSTLTNSDLVLIDLKTLRKLYKENVDKVEFYQKYLLAKTKNHENENEKKKNQGEEYTLINPKSNNILFSEKELEGAHFCGDYLFFSKKGKAKMINISKLNYAAEFWQKLKKRKKFLDLKISTCS